MPVQYDLPEYFNANSVEDVNKYNKLPYYLAKLEAKTVQQWQVYNKLFGKIPWQANMGPVLRGVRAEPTPINQASFYPLPITSTPNKNVYESMEITEDAVLHTHDFDSQLFHFLPSFQDFRENQLEFNQKDIVRQVTVSNDLFIHTQALARCPNVYIVGNGAGTQLQAAPMLDSSTVLTSANDPKSAAYWQAAVNAVNVDGLTLAAIDNATAVLRDDLGAPFFEGTVNTPRDNEVIKGRYVLITSSEAYGMFKWDRNFQQFRNINLSVVNEGFRGVLFDEVTTIIRQYPTRFDANGVKIAPEITLLEDPANPKKARRRPNPAYTTAPYELAELVGADCYKTIKIGPPPNAFAGKMSKEKFYSLKWNGEIILTDQVLTQYQDGAVTRYDTNVRGRFLKLIGTAGMGIIPCNKYNYMPILFRRVRPSIV